MHFVPASEIENHTVLVTSVSTSVIDEESSSSAQRAPLKVCRAITFMYPGEAIDVVTSQPSQPAQGESVHISYN